MQNLLRRAIDFADALSVKAGLLKPASWDLVRSGSARHLYAGRLSRHEPQFTTHVGLTPFSPSSRNIYHDLTNPFPLNDNSIDHFQASDVFEHIEYNLLPAIFSEIYRILRPGGLFRFSVPDYRNPLYRDRSQKSSDGDIIFDPGGGGEYKSGKVIGGGHVWFPTIELVRHLFNDSSFSNLGYVHYLHYIDAAGHPTANSIDYSKGFVLRTPDNDKRSPIPISIVVDAYKGRSCHNA